MGLTHRSQSALEYMMTYGWAILVIVIVAVILYSLGIFSPTPTGPSIFGFSGVQVSSAAISSDSVGLQLQNIVGNPVTIDSINATYNGKTYSAFTCDNTVLAEGSSTTCFVAGNFGSSASFKSVSVVIGYTSDNIFQTFQISNGKIVASFSPFLSSSPFSEAGKIAYVGSWSGALAQINLSSNTVINVTSNIDWGLSQILIAQNNSRAYVPDSWTTLGVFNLTGNSFKLIHKYWGNGCGNNYITLSPNQEYAFVSLDGCSQSFVNVFNLSDPNSYNNIKNIPTQSQPNELITASNGDIYVMNLGSDSISVISPATLSNIDNITNIGAVNGWSIGFSNKTDDVYAPAGTYMYSNISIISTNTNSLVGNITGMGGYTQYMAVGSNGEVYVTSNFRLHFSGNTQGFVSVLNASNYVVTKNIPVQNTPLGLTVAPNGDLYVANANSNSVSVIDTSTNTVVSTLTGNGLDFPRDIVATDGNIYVVNSNGNSVSVFSQSTGAAVTTIGVGSDPYSIAVSPTNSSEIYVTNWNSNTVSVIDANSNSVVSTINVNCGQPDGIAFTPNGGYAYIACWNSNGVSVINADTNTYTTFIGGLGAYNGNIRAIAASPGGNYIYAAGWGFGTQIAEISTSTNTVANRIGLASSTDLSELEFSQHGNRLFGLFADNGESPIVVFNPSTLSIENQVGRLITWCNSPIYVSPNGELGLYLQRCTGSVSIINLLSHQVLYTAKAGSKSNVNWGAFSANSQLAYVDNGPDIQALNVSTGQVEYSDTVGSCPGFITTSTDGDVYVNLACGGQIYPTPGDNGVAVLSYNLEPLKDVGEPGVAIENLQLSQNLASLYVTSQSGFNTMSTASNSFSTEISGLPSFGPVNSVIDGDIAYFSQRSDQFDGSMTIYNLSSSSPIAMIDNIGDSPDGIGFDFATGDIYVATQFTQNAGNYGTLPNGNQEDNGTVDMISGSTYKIIKTLVVPGNPRKLTVTPNNKYVLVTTRDLPTNTLLVIDAATDSLITQIPLGGCSTHITVNLNSTLAFVSDRCSNTIHIINLTSLSQIANVGGGGLNAPHESALTPNGNFLYIANRNSNQVSVLNVSAAISGSSTPFLTPITIPEASAWKAITIG